jgi:alpha/beta superfamily hydrolase
MKYLFIAILFSCSFAFAQNLSGSWAGKVSVQGLKLTLVVNIADSAWTLDSPDQNTIGIKIDSNSIQDGKVYFLSTRIGAEFKGVLKEVDGVQQIDGEFNQMGQKFPLVLLKQKEAYQKPKRPQEPEAPFPYKSKEVKFKSVTSSGKEIEMAGVLTYPKKGKPKAAVVLVSGSGPQDRNEELMGHKPFAVIADYLTRQGIAVLRYDDRGVGESEGDFAKATSFDFADDAEAAHNFLTKKFKKAKVGVVGHSEGGLIAPIVASRNQDLDFIVLLAGPGTKMDHLLLRQSAIVMELNGSDSLEIAQEIALTTQLFDLVKSEKSDSEIRTAISTLIDQVYKERPDSFEGAEPAVIKMRINNQMLNPWFRAILKVDPSAYLTKVNCPVMAVNGLKDCQVPGAENLEAIRKHLSTANNSTVLIKAYPNKNHLFQTCETGAIDEYSRIEETFSEEVLKDMVNWINGL